jgi:uncharacterized repeat protein (TIGR01451 family)
MRHSVRKVAHSLVVVLVLIGGSAFAAALKPTGKSVDGEVLVKIQAGASGADIATLKNGGDVDKSERISNLKSGAAIWRMHSRSKNTEALANALQHNPKVVYVEPNYIVQATATPNDPLFGQLWALKNTGQSFGVAGADIKSEAAWNVTTGSASIVVGVVDTGIDYTHPDLAANVWNNPGGKGSPDCAAGTHGYNAITRTCDPKDDHYHGTHVSGTIGAVGNNSLGVVGVNWTTSIMGLKFLSADGYGTTADAIVAIDFAVQAKIDGVNVRVLSNSWGGGSFSKALLDEINKANENDILFVASAGNNSSNNDLYPSYPASYGTPNMISVAATDSRDLMAYFSNYGPNTVHLGAPGVDVLSCYPGTSYTSLSGTSMAAPHVAGVAALVLANTPSLTTAQVKSAILSNTDPISSLAGRTVTGGRLNAAKAVGATLPPDFVISVSPATRSVVRGASTTYAVTITPSGGFSGSVNLSVTGLPSLASGSFTPNPATGSSTLTVTTGATTPLGSYQLTITGVSGALSHATTTVLSMVATPPPTACPAFTSASSYYVGSAPTAIATGDFNRDGRPDLAVANTSSNTISVLLGTGGGAFQSALNYASGNTPISVAAGDVNGDGKADLAVANSGSSNVSILIGNGDGTFAGGVNYGAGSNPFWLTFGDFNADGNADLAVANNGSSNVSILLGNGDGTLQAAVNYGAGSGPFWVAAADFNRDGKADLAVAEYNADEVSILLGNGDGTFQAAVDYGAGNAPASLAIADFNGDGKFDLAVANYSSDNVSVLAGNGDGTFQAAVNYAVGVNPYSVTTLDVNGDGRADLAVANSGSNGVSLLQGKGDGTFVAAINYAVGSNPNHVVTDDFNGDGKADLATANVDSATVSILRNAGVCALNCSTMAAAVNYAAGTTPESVAAGDFNRDGKTDLAVANNGASSVSINLGNGDGTFQVAADSGAGSTPHFVKTADLDGDGKLDLAVANNDTNQVSILLGNANGTFQGAVPYGTGTNPHSVASGDFNRDGRADLAVANSGSANVSILLGNGDGTLQTAVNYGAGTTPESVAAGDFNRDGRADLVVANSGSANVSVLLGNGNGTFQAAINYGAGTDPFSVAVADFNRDGKLDLAVANSGSNNVSILLGTGTGTFQTAVNYGAGTNPYSVAAGDFNDDGALDLAVANHGSNDSSILTGMGDGSFTLASTVGAGMASYSIAAADFNRDGKPDLAVANSGANNVSILLNTCPIPDLTATKTHAGSFTQGDVGKTYTITVTNSGSAPTAGVVTATDTLPVGLAVTAMSGTGWTCTVATLSCTRSDALAAAASYPPITLTVNVANNAPSTVLNTVTVSGGGEVNSINSSAGDSAAVAPVTDLVVTKKHVGNFTQGDSGKIYTIIARNAGGAPTSGAITVTDAMPAGLTATAISGSGWSCTLGTLTCTRSDVLAGGTSYPAITVTVNVAANAAGALTNTATVSGGGETNTANDTAADPTTVWSSQGCASFGAPVGYSVGSYPLAVTSGDFNGDGKRDLANGNYYNGSVSVLIGSGTGTFVPAVNYTAGSYPIAIVSTDLNNDGKADLVTVNNGSSSVSVLLGNGDGTFAPAMSFGTPSDGRALAVGDFNGDGNADLAVTGYYSSSLSILLGNGNGTLQTAINSSPGPYLNSVVAADFDGDGKLDLGVTSYYNYAVLVLRGNGNGTFQTPVSYGVGSNASSVAVGDFNGDGKADLAVSRSYTSSVAILLGNGDATFQAPVYYETSYSYSPTIAIDDLNGDGKADIALAGDGSSTLSILLGNGNGTFQPVISLTANYGATRIVISDFNGDGKPDLALGNSYTYQVLVMLGGCPDLTIAKSHNGNFTAGQSNATYSLTVTNSAGGSTTGLVTVTDFLPSGLTATAMNGSGWTCSLPNLSCTRSDSLSGGASFPIITLTVTVSKTAASSVTNAAIVSGGADSNNANNSASDPTTIMPAADLTITKTHDATFVQGQIGRTYSITVSNSGSAPSSGTVSVVDILPAALTATAMSGSGWNCTVASQTCTRDDALAVNASYPAITLAVNVAVNAPSNVTNVAVVSGGGQVFTSNDVVSDPTKILSTPTNLIATAISASQVMLTWDPVVNATGYQVLRSSGNAAFSIVGTPAANAFTDTSLTPNTAYLYRVRAVDSSAAGSASNLDLATTILFTDDPVVAGLTKMKAVHVTELRLAVDAVRAAAGLPPASYTDPSLSGINVKAIHLMELRSAMDAARSTLGLSAAGYADPSLAGGSVIKAAHIRDLRAGVK